jgi:hypothetical protein
MALLFRLMSSRTARTFHDWMVAIWAFVTVFVGDVNLDRFQRWLWSTPQEQLQMLQNDPALNDQVQALYAAFQRQMDMQYEIGALKQQMLTLPAIPEEGS